MSRFSLSAIAVSIVFSSLSASAFAETTRKDERMVTAALDQRANTQTEHAAQPVEMDHAVIVWGVKTYPGSKLGTGDHNKEFGYWGLQGTK
jgi:hypothetical protein